jgi:hypothetical protein
MIFTGLKILSSVNNYCFASGFTTLQTNGCNKHLDIYSYKHLRDWLSDQGQMDWMALVFNLCQNAFQNIVTICNPSSNEAELAIAIAHFFQSEENKDTRVAMTLLLILEPFRVSVVCASTNCLFVLHLFFLQHFSFPLCF